MNDLNFETKPAVWVDGKPFVSEEAALIHVRDNKLEKLSKLVTEHSSTSHEVLFTETLKLYTKGGSELASYDHHNKHVGVQFRSLVLQILEIAEELQVYDK